MTLNNYQTHFMNSNIPVDGRFASIQSQIPKNDISLDIIALNIEKYSLTHMNITMILQNIYISKIWCADIVPLTDPDIKGTTVRFLFRNGHFADLGEAFTYKFKIPSHQIAHNKIIHYNLRPREKDVFAHFLHFTTKKTPKKIDPHEIIIILRLMSKFELKDAYKCEIYRNLIYSGIFMAYPSLNLKFLFELVENIVLNSTDVIENLLKRQVDPVFCYMLLRDPFNLMGITVEIQKSTLLISNLPKTGHQNILNINTKNITRISLDVSILSDKKYKKVKSIIKRLLKCGLFCVCNNLTNNRRIKELKLSGTCTYKHLNFFVDLIGKLLCFINEISVENLTIGKKKYFLGKNFCLKNVNKFFGGIKTLKLGITSEYSTSTLKSILKSLKYDNKIGCCKLISLTLHRNTFIDGSVAKLISELEILESLILIYCRINQGILCNILSSVSLQNNLKVLTFIGIEISPNAAILIKRFVKLEKLFLFDCNITDDALWEVKNWHGVTYFKNIKNFMIGRLPKAFKRPKAAILNEI